MVPPLSVTSGWSGMRSITGCSVKTLNSVLLASGFERHAAELDHRHCRPRHRPRKGIFCSRAQRMARTLPSTPRSPKPPGTSTPATPAARGHLLRSMPSVFQRIQRTSTSTWCRAACFSASVTLM